jgi:hypothetical protein
MTDDDNGVFVPPKETYTVKARVCFRDDIDAKAREIAEDLADTVENVSESTFEGSWIAIITAALLAARNEALEEVARVAKKYRGGQLICDVNGDVAGSVAGEAIATAIQALKNKT